LLRCLHGSGLLGALPGPLEDLPNGLPPSRPDDYLLAHELCVVAIGKGEKRARWLAAASEDRFLMALKRPQRFATQYHLATPSTPARVGRDRINRRNTMAASLREGKLSIMPQVPWVRPSQGSVHAPANGTHPSAPNSAAAARTRS
jgi:hypothetical protein